MNNRISTLSNKRMAVHAIAPAMRAALPWVYKVGSFPADKRFQSAQQISEHKFRHMRKPFRLGFRLLEIASEYRRQGMSV